MPQGRECRHRDPHGPCGPGPGALPHGLGGARLPPRGSDKGYRRSGVLSPCRHPRGGPQESGRQGGGQRPQRTPAFGGPEPRTRGRADVLPQRRARTGVHAPRRRAPHEWPLSPPPRFWLPPAPAHNGTHDPDTSPSAQPSTLPRPKSFTFNTSNTGTNLHESVTETPVTVHVFRVFLTATHGKKRIFTHSPVNRVHREITGSSYKKYSDNSESHWYFSSSSVFLS